MIPFPTQAEKDAFLVRIKAHAVAYALDEHAAAAPRHGVLEELLRLVHQLGCEVAFYEAICVGADLTSAVVDRWFLWLLGEELREYTTSAAVTGLYRLWLSGDSPTPGDVDGAKADAEFAAIRAAEDGAPEALAVALASAGRDIFMVVSEALAFTTRPRMAVALLRIVSFT